MATSCKKDSVLSKINYPERYNVLPGLVSTIGEGKATHSSITHQENPMGGGLMAAVHRVTKSWT